MKSFRSVLLTLTICIACMTATAQELPLLYNQEFDAPQTDWVTGETVEREAHIEDGKYIFTRKKDGLWLLNYTVFINWKKDYDIQTTFTQTDGENTCDAGIGWGDDGSANAYFFRVALNGKFKIGKWVEDEPTDIVDWTSHDAIRGQGKANKLVIKRRGPRMQFLVNDQVVHEMGTLPIGGFRVMILVADQQTLEFEHYLIRQEPTAINLMKGMPTDLTKERLDANVNSDSVEKSPVVSNDGLTLYFCRDNYPENVPPDKDDIWSSTRQADGTWGKAFRMPAPLNNRTHNFVINVSPDNNKLLVGNAYTATGEPDGPGVSTSERTATGWTIPTKVNIDNYVNKNKYVEYTISPDQRVLVMVVERDGCIGERDMYVSFRKADGTFSTPTHMGDVINSPGDEAAPFIAADGSTLYFASEGHMGYGSSDIFMSRRLDSTWMNWTEPVNLGKPINDEYWNAYFTIPAQGEFAYLVGSSAGRSSDIWKVNVPQELRPRPVVLVKGKVLDAKTLQPLPAAVAIEQLASGKSVASATADPVTGEYTIVLYPDDEFAFFANKSGYFPVSQNVDTRGLKTFTTITRDLLLEPLEAGRSIRLNNIFFDTGSDILRETSFADLNRLVDVLNANPQMIIEVSGHTDDVGKDADNMKLSQRRATSVETYLTSKSIAPSRLKSKGYGETKPNVKAQTEEARQLNRRVEFMITK